MARGVTKLELDITKTIENTNRLKNLPPIVESEINSSPLQEDFKDILENNDDFVIDDFDIRTVLPIDVTTTRVPVISRDNNISSSSSRSSTTPKSSKSTTISLEKPASVVTPPILLEQTTLLISTTPTTLLPKVIVI